MDRRNPSLTSVLAWVLLLAWVVGLVAAPAQAQEEAPLLLGQMTSVELDAGEAATYRFAVAIDGLYFLSVFEGDPTGFRATLTDDQGEIIAEDTLEALDSAPIDLTEGTYRLTVAAEEDGEVRFALMGMIGSMGRQADEPGLLHLGGAVLLSSMRSPRYGTLEIPEFPYPMPVFVVAAPEEGEQPVGITVEGDDNVEVFGSNVADPTDLAMALFWTDGGQFTVTMEPWDTEAAVIAMVLLGPSPEIYQVGDVIEDSLVEGIDRWIYVLELDSFYEELTVTLTWEDEDIDLDLTVADALVSPLVEGSSLGVDVPLEEVSLAGVLPGRYLITVNRASMEDMEVPFTLEITGQEGTPPTPLEEGTFLEGEIREGETRYYRFEAPAGRLIRVALASDDEDAALGFDVGLRPRLGNLASSSLFLEAVAEAVFVTPVEGTYYVAVYNEGAPVPFQVGYLDEGTPPVLEANDVRTGEVAPGETAFFLFPVETEGAFVSVFLVGDGTADLDLTLELVDERGESPIYQSSTTLSANELVGQADAPAGRYTVQVTSYGDAPSRFTLISRVETPQELVQVSLDVTNESEAPVCTVYVTPTESTEEPTNRLEEPLEPGDTVVLELTAGHYDLMAYDCEGELVDAVEDATLQDEMFWRIRP